MDRKKVTAKHTIKYLFVQPYANKVDFITISSRILNDIIYNGIIITINIARLEPKLHAAMQLLTLQIQADSFQRRIFKFESKFLIQPCLELFFVFPISQSDRPAFPGSEQIHKILFAYKFDIIHSHFHALDQKIPKRTNPSFPY